MTKKAFLAHVAALYRAMNMADSDNPARARWMDPSLAGANGCAILDQLLHAQVAAGTLTHAELQVFHDTL